MDGKAKRDKVVELVKMLKDRGLRIDAVGYAGTHGNGLSVSVRI